MEVFDAIFGLLATRRKPLAGVADYGDRNTPYEPEAADA